MSDKWKTYWNKYKVKIITAGGCFLAALICMFAIANAERLHTVFDPSDYANQADQETNQVAYDASVFSSDKNNNDGLEMDKKAEEDYKLDNGDENILDQEDDSFQNGPGQGNGNGPSLQIGDGTGDSTGDGSPVGLSNDGNGNNFFIPNTGNSDNNNQGTGNPGGNLPGGSGGSTDSDNPGGSDTPGGPDNPGGPDIPIPTPPEPTPEQPTPTPDPDDDRYGTDYNSPEHVETDYPDPTADQDKKVTVTELSVTGSLQQHFYKGEFPRSEEMEKYITVTATMSDGSVRKNLKFIPFAGKGTGGDYSVDWSATEQEAADGVGTEVGSNHEATITYRDKSIKVSYDIVDWQLKLKDFDETAMTTIDPGYEEFERILSPDGSPIIDLDDSMQSMYNLIYFRTEANINDGMQYEHVNVQPNPWDTYYTEFFGGWTFGSVNCGVLYKMERPTDSQIDNGVYTVTLEPAWENVENQTDYIIGLDGDPFFSKWNKKLLGYTGDSDVLKVPDGVNTVNIVELQSYMMWNYFESENDKVTRIELPASVTEYSNDFGFDSSYVNYFTNLQEYDVAKENQTYMSIDGIIYDKPGQILRNVPPAKKSINKWSKNVYWIAADAFEYTDMEEVNVPAGVYRLNGFCFLNANIGTLTLNCTDELELNTSVFDCNQFDMDGNPLMTIQKIVLKTDELALSEGTNLFTYLSENKIDVSDLGMSIVQDLSGQDVDKKQGYLDTFKALQTGIDIFNGNMNCTSSIFTTVDHTEDEFTYKDGYMLSKTGDRLYFASAILAGDINLPEGLKIISGGALKGCDKITAMVVPAGLEAIETDAFAETKALDALYLYGDDLAVLHTKIFGDTIKDGFKIYVSETADASEGKKALDRDYGTGTGDKVFSVMEDMENKVLNNGNTYLKNEIEGTYTLLSVKPAIQGIFEPMEGTTAFADQCFKDCANLQGVIIPDDVTSIGQNVFEGCSSLRVVAVNATEAPDVDEAAFAGVDISQIALFVPSTAGAKDTYVAGIWSGFASIDAPEASYFGEAQNVVNGAIYGVKADGYNLVHAFVNEWGIFTLKDNTTEIYDNAFRDCDSLTGVNNSGNVTRVGAYAFENCDTLNGVELLTSEEITLGKGAFKNCPSFTSFYIADGEWGGVYIPANIKSLPDECFEGLGWWGDVQINGDMTYIGKNCFANCVGISSITFLGTVDQMGDGCFQGCSSLMTITSHDPEQDSFDGFYYSTPFGLEKIPDNCFSGCSMLGSGCGVYNIISIQSQTVGNFAFAGCESIGYLEFPMLVTELGEGSFQGCSGLTTISSQVPAVNPEDPDEDTWPLETLPYNVRNIPAHCFENCTSLGVVRAQGRVDSIGADAFSGDSLLTTVSFSDIGNIDPNTETADTVKEAYFKNCPLASLLVNGVEMIAEAVPSAEASPEAAVIAEAEPQESEADPQESEVVTEPETQEELAQAEPQESEAAKTGETGEGEEAVTEDKSDEQPEAEMPLKPGDSIEDSNTDIDMQTEPGEADIVSEKITEAG